jgi:hypothetical protein
MASFGAYLDSVSLPIVKNVLFGLGIGTVTYTGLDVLFNNLQSLIVNNLNSLSGATAALFYLAGGFQCVGLVLAGYSAKMSMMIYKKFVAV